MPPKTSKKIKELQLELKLHDKQLARAVDYARKHPEESKAKVAKAFGVNSTTLRRRCKGTQTARSKARQEQQLLTAGEEEAIVDWCGRMSDLYFPVTLLMLMTMAIRILQARILHINQAGRDKIIPGIHWAQRFLSRHPSIKLKYCEYLDKARGKVTATVEERRKWYQTLQSLMRQYKITPGNLWNCDEKGLIISLALGRQKVIVRANSVMTDGSREFCTVIETVSATGHVIQPFVVWASEVHCTSFYGSTGVHKRPATFSRSPSGYMDDELCLDYIIKHFNPHTATKDTSTGTWRMLIVDGHSSHVPYPVVEYGLDHGIVIYCLPPHSTHVMQPLDVACFGPLSRTYRTALQDFIYDNPGKAFGKQEFWECLCTARDQALSKDNILGGFEVSGIWPLRPEELLDHQI